MRHTEVAVTQAGIALHGFGGPGKTDAPFSMKYTAAQG